MRSILQFSFIVFLIQVGNQLNGQAKKEDKFNIEVKSPDATQLSKFVDIPASTHTGAIAVDIPIFNIKCDDFSLPISLKYHTSGVKVNEIASKVGLGWSLSIGGIALNKQIIGNEDKGFIPNLNQIDGAYTPNDRNSNDHGTTIGITGFNIEDPNWILSGQKRDTQPDIFSYSLGSSSGDFYLDTSGNPIKIGETSVKIMTYPFVLTNDVGNKFYFSTASTMKTVGGGIPSVENLVITDFKIDKIVLKNGREINFQYETIPTYKYLSSYYKGYSYPISCQTSIDFVNPEVQYNEYASMTEVIAEKYLKKIIYPEGFVTFTYASREDMTNGLSLINITANNNSGIVANYQLNKNYFTTSDVKNINGYGNETDKLTKRLKLYEVKNLLDDTKYQLNYHELHPLPNRLSDAKDYVGFYNGEILNKGIPFVAIDDTVYGWGDNKNPNIDFAVSGSLKEISYPTGGKMKIEYELDDFDYESYLPETSVSQNEEVMNSGDLESTIFVNSDATKIMFKVNFSSTANLDNDGSGSLPLANSSYFIAEIRDANNVVLNSFFLNGDYEFFLDKKPQYKLRIIKHGSPSIDKYANYIVKWFEINHIPSIRHNKSVGGIRVKKITKEDNQGIELEDRFIYKDDNNRSTGVFMGDPLNYYYFNLTPLGYWGESCNHLIISNSGNFNLSTINGKPTVYNKVITERINVKKPDETYKIIDTYLNSPSTNYYNSDSPFQTYVNNQYARGILRKKDLYDSNNNIQKEIEYDYINDNYFNQRSNDYLSVFPSLTIRPYQIKISKITKERVMGSVDSFFYIPTFEFTRYEMTSGWMKLNFQKTTTHFGNNNLMETTNYFYNNNHDHLNPVKTSNLISTGDITETNYSYAQEKSNQYLIDKNMVGIPLETTVIKKQNSTDPGKTISQVETKYPTSQAEADTKTSGLALPYEVWSKDLQNTLTKEVTYDKYDTFGNILQYTSKAGIPTTIIWGYKNTQPIAKIEGATYAQVQNEIAAIVSASNADAIATIGNDESSFLGLLDTFRKSANLSSYQITTYTYDPLIGVRSITPPSGIRAKYIYDAANRLEKIVQEDGKVLQEYKYNYKQ